MKAVRSGGFEEMTIRSLAADLGVSPMSLYRHVRDKDDLLEEVVDRLLARSWRPTAAPPGWRAWVAEASDKLRHLLVTRPAALHVYLRQPVVSPAAITRMETMMDVLREAGFDEKSARRAYAAIHTYTVGFAALEASRARWALPEGTPGGMADQLAAFTTPRQFAEGLQYLLDGIEGRSEMNTSRLEE
jgi:AcrR family transcriptional regulator